MVAKLIIGLAALVLFLMIVFGMAFWYFNQRDERRHEKRMRRFERDERIVETVGQDSIDQELERERER